jgi:chromosome segregation ATPase
MTVYRPTATVTVSTDHPMQSSTWHRRRPSPSRHALVRTARLCGLLAVVWACGTAASAWAQSGIYTCIDAQGRRITSDRPIPACLDREQTELNPSGTVKRVVPPSLTAQERARAEAQRQAEAQRLAQAEEERRKLRLLLVRYPDTASHQRAREDALQQVDRVIEAVHKRVEQLDAQRREIDAELEFYQRDPAKAPAWLKRRQEDNAQQRASQAMFLADQEREKARIHQRFNDELALLRELWAGQATR